MNISKIGNAIIYIVDEVERRHLQKVYITKLLKLLYIIDETSVVETSTSITGLTYKVWEMGPVAVEIWDHFKNNNEHFALFTESKNTANSTIIKSINKFDDSEFSDYEMRLIDKVIDKYGHLDGPELVALLHEEGGLWDQVVKKYNLQEEFKKSKATLHKIDFAEKLTDNYRKFLFKESRDANFL